MIHTDGYDCRYYESLDEAREDGFTPVKATSLLRFFKLSNRRSVICKENVTPFTDLSYLIYSGASKRYYLRSYRGWTLDETFFYYERQGNDRPEIEGFLRYVSDGNVYILFTGDHLSEIIDMMNRCYRKKYNGNPPEDKWSNTFYQIMHEELKYEEYKDFGKNLIGFLTVCKQYEERIKELWNSVYLKTQKK